MDRIRLGLSWLRTLGLGRGGEKGVTCAGGGGFLLMVGLVVAGEIRKVEAERV